MDVKVIWIPRKLNGLADKISKDIDHDDWEISLDTFHLLNEKWGPITVDRFANHMNCKLHRFNSKYFCPNS